MMNSNWQKLLAKKQQAVVVAGKRKRAHPDSAPSRVVPGERPSQRVKQQHNSSSNSNSQQQQQQQQQQPAKKPRVAFQGFIPVIGGARDERKEAHLDSAGAVAAAAAPLGLKPVDGEPTRIVAIDCEMVGVQGEGRDEERSVIARVSLVNYAGKVVYDRYVRSEEPVVNYRTAVSGIHPYHIEGPHAIPFERCTKEVADLLRNRVLVGHAVHHDLKALMLSHPGQDIRDTARYRPFCPTGPKSLKKLCKDVLGLEIQDGQHCSVEDARSALALYKSVSPAWEAALRRKQAKKAAGKRKPAAPAAAKRVPAAGSQTKGQPRRVPPDADADAAHPFA